MASTNPRLRPGPKPVERRAEWTARVPKPVMAALEDEARNHGFSRNDWLSILLAERYGKDYSPTRRSADAHFDNQEAFFSKVS